MEINTKLENDTVLFTKYANTHSRGKIIQSLNRLGFFTVSDLINANPEVFTEQSRDQFTAIAAIFKHEYLGEPFAYEYIFNKIYDLNNDMVELSRDIKTLGIVKDYRYVPEHLKDCLENFQSNVVTMEYVLGLCYYDRRDLANYYVDVYQYSHSNKSKKENNFKFQSGNKMVVIPEFSSSVKKANNLIVEINTITNIMNDLDLRIEQSPNKHLFEFRTYLDITLKDKQNQLNQLKGFDRKRTKE